MGQTKTTSFAPFLAEECLMNCVISAVLLLMLFGGQSLAQGPPLLTEDPKDLNAVRHLAVPLSRQGVAEVFDAVLADKKFSNSDWFVFERNGDGHNAQIALVTNCSALSVCDSYPDLHIVVTAICDTGCKSDSLPPSQVYAWISLERARDGFRFETKDSTSKMVWTYWNIATVAATNFKSVSQQTSSACQQFSVLVQDELKNVKPGLSLADQKWFREKVQKKYPSLCFVEPSADVPLMFVVIITPDTYHGTRVVTDTQTTPVEGTITDEDGNVSTLSGTQKTSSSTAVPYSFDYGIFTLTVEKPQKDGTYLALHRFQQKGIYDTLYGIPLGGKGHHPLHAVIEEAAEWVNKGGLVEAERLVSPVSTPPASSHSEVIDEAGVASALGNSSVTRTALDISSNPTGAEIEIDGAFVGNTPASVEVSPGEHFVAISKNGFASWERKLTAVPGRASISPLLQPSGSRTTY
jgi:hypothetical protein